MSPVELLDFLAKLGPLAREHGIETVEFEDGALKAATFFRQQPQMGPVGATKRADGDGSEKPRPSFAGRTAEEIRNAIPNWGTE